MFEYHEFACSPAGCTWVHTVVPFLDVAVMVRKLYGLWTERKGCVWSCLVCGDVALGEAVQRVVLLAVGSGAEAQKICQKRLTNVKKRLTKRKQGDHICKSRSCYHVGKDDVSTCGL